MEKIFSSILELKRIRNNTPQLLFIESIQPKSAIELRQAIITFKSENPNVEEIDFIINSPGGLADDAYRIIRTLRMNFETVNIIIPFWAKSAATLLSLGGSNIIMDEFGEFGPLDAQLGKPRDDSPEFERESALNDEHTVSIIETHYKQMYESMFLQVYEHDKINIQKNELSKQLLDHLSKFYEPLLKQIDPYKLGDKRRKLDIATQYAKRILVDYGGFTNKNKLRQLVNYLVDECPDHGFVIDYGLISLFHPNIHKGDFFGHEYQQELSKLSMLFIEYIDNDTEYVAFVEAPKIELSDEDDKHDHTINLEGETLENNEKDINFVPEKTLKQVDKDEIKQHKQTKTT